MAAEEERADLLRELHDNRRNAPRSEWLLKWCSKMAVHAFLPPGSAMLTEWGVHAMKALLLSLTESPDILSPEVNAWLERNLIPCLFREDQGGTVAMHSDLIYLLIQLLLRNLNSTTTPDDADAVQRPLEATTPPDP